MKKKLTSLLLTAIAVFSFSVDSFGKTDVTSTYLQDANLKSLGSWTLDKLNGFADKGYTDWQTSTDVPVIEFYNAWSPTPGGSIGNTKTFNFSQKIKLPAGYYRLAVNAFYREGAGNGTNTKAYIYAGQKIQYVVGLNAAGVGGYTGSSDLAKAANAFYLGNFSNEFDFNVTSETEIEIGFHGYIDTYCSWCILGPVTLWEYTAEDYISDYTQKVAEAEALYTQPMNKDVLDALKDAAGKESTLVSVDDVLNAVKALNTAIENANNSIALYKDVNTYITKAENHNAAVKAAFEASGIKAAYEAGTLVDVNSAIEAYRNAILSQTAVGSDISEAFTLISDDMSGWTTDITNGSAHFKQNTWSNEGETDGSGMVIPFMEYWLPNGSVLDNATLKYKFTGLVPNQYYEISALVRAYKEKQVEDLTGAYLFAGSAKSLDISTGTNASNGESGIYYGVLKATGKANADGDLEAGFIVDNCNFNWLAAKNFTVKVSEDPGISEIQSQFNTLIAKAEEIKDLPMDAALASNLVAAMATPESTSEAYATAIENLDIALKAAQASVKKYAGWGVYVNRADKLDDSGKASYTSNETYITISTAYNAGNLDEITSEQIAVLDEAFVTATKLQTSEGSDFTGAIVNPSFETGNTDGWTVGSSKDTGARSNGNATYTMSGADGNWVFNTWTTGLPITQTITGLPNGTYKLSAVIASDATIKVFITANGERTGAKTTQKEVGKEVELEFVVSDNTATIGAIGGSGDNYVADGGDWYKVDNFRLTYISDKIPAASLGIATFTGNDSDDAKLIITFDNFNNQLAAQSPDNKYVIDITINGEEYKNTCSADKGAVIGYDFSSVETYTIIIPDKGIKLVNSMDEVIAETKGEIKETFSLYSDNFTNGDFAFGTPVSGTIRTYAKDIVAGSDETSGMHSITGWSYTVGGDAHAAGIFEYGSGVGLGDESHMVPNAGPDGTNGHALGVLGVWTASSSYTQTIRLGKGSYMVQIPTYNAGGTDNVVSLTGVLINGKCTYSKTTTFKPGVWTTQTIEFTLTETSAVTVSLGYTAPNKGSGSCPHLFYDRVDIFSNEQIAAAKLASAKADALASVSVLTPIGDGIFKYSQADIDEAIAEINSSTTIAEINAVKIPEMNLPAEDAPFQIALKSSGYFMSLNSNGVVLSKYAQPLYLKSYKGGYAISDGNQSLAYLGTNTWSLVGSDKASTMIITPVGESYTIKGTNGFIGVDNDEMGSSVFGNKDSHDWLISEYVPVDLNIADVFVTEAYDHIAADEVTISAAVDGTTAVINNGTFTANSVTLNIEVPNNKWSFVVMPCDIPVADLKNTQENTQWKIYRHDGTARANGDFDNVWVAVSESEILLNGEGYIFQSRRGEEATSVFSFTTTTPATIASIFANSDIKVTLNENKSIYACNSGWNLVGNPYLAFFNKSKMSTTAPIIVWEDNNYVTYTVDDNYVLSPLQAFFIQTSEEAELTFSKDGRQTDATISSDVRSRRLPVAMRALYDITLSDGNNIDKTRFVINDGASLNYEICRDASKFMSEDVSVPQIFTVENNVNCSVNERPLSTGIINLGVRVGAAGEYTISARTLASAVVLEDKATGATVVLDDKNDSYTFTVAEACTMVGRFVIHADEATAISGIAADGTDKTVYTIQGVKVSKNAVKKGIYLVGGKKVMVK